MADYDVQPISLTAPPQPAYVTPYRPAVLVRNNGIHEAYAAGILRIYTAGHLIFTTSILSGIIQPKGTKEALALEYWTPPAPSTYLCVASATTEHDQNTTNDNLAPVTFSVISGPPPPPPAVTAHAAQHEENGADEIDLDGLRGRLADLQDPSEHHTAHEATGDDPIDVTGLHGVLADGQTTGEHGSSKHNSTVEATTHKGQANGYAPLGADSKVPTDNLPPLGSAPHAATHENEGDDEISIAGLSGKAADAQTPEPHNHPYQPTDEKGQANGYTELDQDSKVPAARLGGVAPPQAEGYLCSDMTWKTPPKDVKPLDSSQDNAGHNDGLEHDLSTLLLPLDFWKYSTEIDITTSALLQPYPTPTTLIIKLYHQRTDVQLPRRLIGQATFGPGLGAQSPSLATLTARLMCTMPGPTASTRLTGIISRPTDIPGKPDIECLRELDNINSNGSGQVIVTCQYFDTIGGVSWESSVGSLICIRIGTDIP